MATTAKPATKRADQLKPGDRVWIWSDIYTVTASRPGRRSRWRLDLWHHDLGTLPTDFRRDDVLTLVGTRNAWPAMARCYSCVGTGRRTPRAVPDQQCPRCKGGGQEPQTAQAPATTRRRRRRTR